MSRRAIQRAEGPEQSGGTEVRRIAFLVYSLGDRAVARLTVQVSEVLADTGIDVALIDFRRAGSSTLALPENATVHHLDVGARWPILGVRRLASLLKELDADVLFAQLNGPGRAAIMARGLAGVSTRVVVVEHIHYSFYRSHRWLRDRLTAFLYPRADRVAGVSPGVVDELLSRFPRLTGKTAVLPVVATDRDWPGTLRTQPPGHPWYRAPRVRLVCSVGNIVPRKGQHTLIEALPLVRREVGDVRLVLVGRFDDANYVARLHRLAADLDVSDWVSFEGYRANALPYIAGADVFALASTLEGAGMVLLEAMACGVPVVSTDCPSGPSYLLDGGRCGLLVPVGDHAEMARAIITALEDRELRRTLVARASRRASLFSPREVANAYLTLAKESVSGPVKAGRR
jgi:glycosyltransferase involved in cell wall biosynthesis